MIVRALIPVKGNCFVNGHVELNYDAIATEFPKTVSVRSIQKQKNVHLKTI